MTDRLEQRIQELYEPVDRRHEALRGRLLAVLSERKTTRRSPKKRETMNMNLLKWAGAAGIAACLIVVAGVFMLNHSVSSASAAEALRQATTATSQYAGWIHVEQFGKNPPRQASFYLNTETDTVAMSFDFLGRQEVLFLSPTKGEYLHYNASTHTIVSGVNDALEAQAIADRAKRDFVPETLIDGLREYATLSVTRSKQGILDRFDIDIEAFNDRKVTGPEKLIVLVHPDTSLIQEIQVFVSDIGPLTMRFTYGGPAIESIYDLGVPKDAAVVQMPQTQPASASQPTPFSH